MADLVIADYSQWQGVVRPPAGQVVIIRAHNGYSADPDFAANRANAHAAGCPAVGLYQYLPANVDAGAAAAALVTTIDRLGPNEWLICDLEEGKGDEQPRWHAWHDEAVSATGRAPWLYSGLNFAQVHDLDPDWVAAYGPVEPTIPHKLWQNTDAYPWPWGPSDASIFHGTLPEFLASVGITLPGPVKEVPAMELAAPIVCAIERPQRDGGWLIGADGGTFAWGAAGQHGNPTGVTLAKPIVAAVAAADGEGYTLIGADGGTFVYGTGPKIPSLA